MRSRRRYPVAVLFLLAAIILTAAFAANALALPTFTQAIGGVGPCATCHTQSATHGLALHAAVFPTCSNCHVNGDTAVPPTPAKCATCHGGANAILSAHAAAPAPGHGCATTVGCHGVVVAIPVVSGFLPTSGGVGTTVTLTGTGFPGATGVTFNGVAAVTFSVDTPTSMTVKVPAGATTGPIAVTTSAGTGTSVASFTVTVAAKPAITKLTPTAGKRASIVVITGKTFGAKRATSFVKFGATKASKYISWSNTKIKLRVPKAKFGLLKVKVTTSVGTSNAKSFRVKR